MSDELNPNHPATREVHDHWHKIAALMMFKMGVRSPGSCRRQNR